MKITNIELRNFMGIEALSLDIPSAPVVLLCGPNASGKSTMLEAIRWIMTKRIWRQWGEHTCHYAFPEADPSRSGHARMTLGRDKRIGRDTAGSLCELISPTDAQWNAHMESALFNASLTQAAPSIRAELLWALSGAPFGAEQLRTSQSIAKWGGAPEFKGLLQVVLDDLDTSIGYARKGIEDKVKQLKAQWQEVTGEKWGIKKAATWHATASVPMQFACPHCRAILFLDPQKLLVSSRMPAEEELNDTAQKKTTEALLVNRKIGYLNSVRDELDPMSGVRSVQMRELIQALNAQARALGEALEMAWPSEIFSPQMALHAGPALSTSERWLIDVAAAVALSRKHSPWLLIDNFDIVQLQERRRGLFLKWLANLVRRGDYLQIFIAATLKDKPGVGDASPIAPVWLPEHVTPRRWGRIKERGNEDNRV